MGTGQAHNGGFRHRFDFALALGGRGVAFRSTRGGLVDARARPRSRRRSVLPGDFDLVDHVPFSRECRLRDDGGDLAV
jgi:hypothetical protein